MALENRQRIEIVIAVMFIVFLILLAFYVTNPSTFSTTSSSSTNSENTQIPQAVIINSFNNYNMNSREGYKRDYYDYSNYYDYYNYEDHYDYLNYKDTSYLRYSSSKEHQRTTGIFGNSIDRYIVNVKNQDRKGGYFTVNFYFTNYNGETINYPVTKYIKPGEKEKFTYQTIYQNKYEYQNWNYEVIPQTKTSY